MQEDAGYARVCRVCKGLRVFKGMQEVQENAGCARVSRVCKGLEGAQGLARCIKLSRVCETAAWCAKELQG